MIAAARMKRMITVRLPEPLLQEINRAAYENGESQNAWCVRVLQEELARQEAARVADGALELVSG